MSTDGYDDARSESIHHCPKSRQGAVANDVEIERIRTPHTTVSQQAEQVRVVTGNRATQKDDRSRRKIVRTKLRDESGRLQLQSRITNESQYQFGDPSYTATQPRWQSTIDMMKSSTEQRIFKKREIAVSDQSSPTDKSKAHLQVLPTSQEPTWRQSTETCTNKSTK